MRLSVLSLLLSAVVATGCAKARAETVPDGPPLTVPDPPARVLMPVEEPLPAVAVAPEPAPVPAPRPPARPPARRPTASNTPEQEPARPAEATPAPAAAAAPTPTPQPPALRATPTAADASSERGVRDAIARATRDINRVDYGRLSADGRAQYEQSKRFASQAEQALKDRNFPFAATLADKAATLAAELLGSR